MSDIKKEALAQPLDPKTMKEMGGEGIFTGHEEDKEFPKGGIKEHTQILKDTGASSLFGEKPPMLRKFYMPKYKNVFSLPDGTEWIWLREEKPNKKDPNSGFFLALGPLSRNENKEIDWSKVDYNPVKLAPYDKYKEIIGSSAVEAKDKKNMLNEFINRHNEMLDKMSDKKGGTVTVLPLQLKWAEEMLEKRLKELKNIDANVQKNQEKTQKGLGVATKGLEEQKQQALQGKSTSMADYAVSILEDKFHSVKSLEELKSQLASIKHPYDPQTNEIISKYLNQVVDWQIKARNEDAAKKEQGKEERAEKVENVLPEMEEQLKLKIKPIEALPGKTPKTTGFYGPEFVGTQAHEIGESTKQDFEELSAILGSLTLARQTIADLPTATNEYLLAGGGQRAKQIEALIANINIFKDRYKEQPIVPSQDDPSMAEINPKLFGRSQNTLGNALIAVVLNQLSHSVKGELDRIRSGKASQIGGESVKVAPAQPTGKPLVPASSKKDRIEKLSSALWHIFAKRMGL